MEERKEYTKAEKNNAYLVISIIVLLLIGAFIGIAFALKYNVSGFTNNWFWFFLIGSVLPLMLFRNCVYAFIFVTRSETDKKNCINNFYKYVGLIWIINAYYAISFSFDSIAVVIVGTFLLVGLLGSIVTNFLGDSKIYKAFVPYDFAIAIGFTIYLIYIIDNEKLRSIVIPIVAAVYGGLITLTGVALTIKHSDKERKEIETNKAKPIFSIDVTSLTTNYKENNNITKADAKIDINKNYFYGYNIIIHNTDNSNIKLNSIYSSGETHYVFHNNLIPKSTDYTIAIGSMKWEKELCDDIQFITIDDVLGNHYTYQLNYHYLEDENLFYATIKEHGMSK